MQIKYHSVVTLATDPSWFPTDFSAFVQRALAGLLWDGLGPFPSLSHIFTLLTLCDDS